MYCKLFASLYQGTLRGRTDEIMVFTNLLAHCGKDGTVDKHFRAISEETGLSMERVRAAIDVLESPDPESRSPEENGARIVRMDEHRIWGWRVVNYGKYRAIRSEDDRAEQNRLAQQRWRERNNSKPPSAESKQDKPKERERDKQMEKEKKPRPAKAGVVYSEEFLKFWQAYPKKKVKGDAWRAWKYINPMPDLADILAAVARDCADPDWRKERGRFVPLPATWINGRRWEDEGLFFGQPESRSF